VPTLAIIKLYCTVYVYAVIYSLKLSEQNCVNIATLGIKQYTIPPIKLFNYIILYDLQMICCREWQIKTIEYVPRENTEMLHLILSFITLFDFKNTNQGE